MGEKKEKVISTKYGKGTNYNDEIEGYELVDNEDGYNYVSNEQDKKEFTIRNFPDADW